MKVGVLSLQGAITPHVQMLERLGATPVRVTTAQHLEAINRLILPGGESTTMLKLLDREGLWDPLLLYCKAHPVWGTCAGAILLAEEVYNPSQKSFKLAPVAAHRNAYGSQRESFKTSIMIEGFKNPVEVDFIRAPKLLPLQPSVSVLGYHESQPVIMQYKNILLSSFHVELGEDTSLHRYFIEHHFQSL